MANTANLNLPLPTEGADDDTWGDINNDVHIGVDAVFKADGTGTSVGANVGAGKTLNALDGTVVLGDAGLTLKDTADPTKIAAFQCSGITAGQTRTLTIPDASGKLLINNAPIFSARNASSQTVTSAALTKVTLGTEVFDTGSYFASSTFTPLVAGYYQLHATMYVGATNVSRMSAAFYKNGSSYQTGAFIYPGTGTDAIQSISAIVYLNGSTDYVELWGSVTGTGTCQFVYASADFACSFSGALVRPD